MSNSLWPHGLQHTRLPYPSPTPRACSNSSSLWSHPTILSSVVPFSSCLQSFAKRPIKVFSNESVLCIRWPKYQSFSFSISTSNEYSGLISFRIDWFNLLAVQGTLKSLLQTTVQKYQFFGTQLSLWSSSHIHIEKTIALFPDGLLSAKWVLCLLLCCIGLYSEGYGFSNSHV